MVVVLPAPLPPSSAVNRASRHGEAEVVDGHDVAVALGQVLHPNGWAQCATARAESPARADRHARDQIAPAGRWGDQRQWAWSSEREGEERVSAPRACSAQ